MESKFKIGDKVLVTKPKERGADSFFWDASLAGVNGKILIVKDISKSTGRYYFVNNGVDFFLCESWLTKVEDEAITEEPKVVELKSIDWEQRRWELLCQLIIQGKHIDVAMGIVDTAIEKYKK